MQSSQKHTFVTLGEAMAMFVAEHPGKLSEVDKFGRSLAGAEVNVAIGMSRLGFEANYISKVGQDSLGEFVRQAIGQENIGTERISETDQHATGFMLKSNVTDGSDPLVDYFRRNSAASTLDVKDIDPSLFTPNTHVHLTGVAAAISDSVRSAIKQAIKLAKENGCSLSFDTNLRPSLWPNKGTMISTINEFAFASDIVLPGIEEGLILMGSEEPEAIADFYLSNGAKAVIVKLGSEGAYYKTAQGESGVVAGFPVEQVVDTVGAGDSFAVGVISALLDGKTMEQAAKRGNLLGSMTVQVRGDSEALPSREALTALEG
ncbi:sugar kinase [Marinomonas epiphytica]